MSVAVSEGVITRDGGTDAEHQLQAVEGTAMECEWSCRLAEVLCKPPDACLEAAATAQLVSHH